MLALSLLVLLFPICNTFSAILASMLLGAHSQHVDLIKSMARRCTIFRCIFFILKFVGQLKVTCVSKNLKSPDQGGILGTLLSPQLTFYSNGTK